MILGNLKPSHLFMCCQVSRRMAQLCASEPFWHSLTIHHFGQVATDLSHRSVALTARPWLQVYQSLHSLPQLHATTPDIDGGPAGRHGHASVVIGQCLYVFFGETRGAHTPDQRKVMGDVWKMQLLSGAGGSCRAQWEELLIEEVRPHNTPPPFARWGHSATVVNGVVYIYGGFSDNNRQSDEDGELFALHGLSGGRLYWQKMSSNIQPRIRAFHTTTATDEGGLLVYGGMDHLSQTFEEIYRLDLPSKEGSQVVNWHKLQPKNNLQPMGRAGHSAVWSRFGLICIGGINFSSGSPCFLEEVMVFDSRELLWNPVLLHFRDPHAPQDTTKPAKHNRRAPIGRRCAGVVACGDSVIVSGGAVDTRNGYRWCKDVFVLKFEDMGSAQCWWPSIVDNGRDDCSPREGHSFNYLSGKLVMYGGMFGMASNKESLSSIRVLEVCKACKEGAV